MDIVLAFKALILGIVEGLTEFLPISSTGHLILAGDLLNFNNDKGKVFEIAIQVGAILAVCWEYRQRLADVLRGLYREPRAQRFAANVIVATLPAITLALVFGKTIKAHLFNPPTVALALIVGGLVILWAENRAAHAARPRDPRANALLASAKAGAPRIQSMDDLTLIDSLKIGLAQCAALIPGTSRSGATIIGGMLFGVPRVVATEFSFFLAMPVLAGASLYELAKARDMLSSADLGLFSIGFASAFVSAFLCVRWLLRFVATHDFKPFAWYRIVFGALILISGWAGWIKWSGH